MMQKVAIVGGGIAGLTAAWQLARLAATGIPVRAQLFESSARLGGIVQTIPKEGFTIECGPDAWVTEKPWAHELIHELGLEEDLLSSNDATRKTHILINGRLEAMPDGMRMMVPANLSALDASHLFSPSAKRAYHQEFARATELKASASQEDESIASFTRRHFGQEVLTRIAAPLLSGVLGGDVESLSVQAVMPQFVKMEREHGSLIAALASRAFAGPPPPIFTTLRDGLGTLIDRLTAAIPQPWLQLETAVTGIAQSGRQWTIRTDRQSAGSLYDAVFLAVPPHVSRDLLQSIDPDAAALMPTDASSAIVVALAYRNAGELSLPPGFGFLVPPATGAKLLACTFVDQKFAHRVPHGGRLLRAFFGAGSAEALLAASDEQLTQLAQEELRKILGPLPTPDFSVIRRWPRSLPQYAVGHLTRMATLESRIEALPGFRLLGNGYRGVGLPDLIRDARKAAMSLADPR